MAVFSFEGRDKDHVKVSGTLEAESKTQAIRLLELRGVLPTRLISSSSGKPGSAHGGGEPGLLRRPSAPSDIGAVLRTAKAWQERTAELFEEHRTVLRRVWPALAIAALLSQMLAVFPIGNPKQTVVFGMLLSGLTAWSVRQGLLWTLAALILAIAFQSPALATLFAAAAFVVLVIALAKPYHAVVLLLSPLILQTGFGLALPLGAGLFLSPGAAFMFAAASAFVSLGYMAVTGLPSLGPLVLNQDAALRLVGWENAGFGHAFFSFDWLRSIPVADTLTFAFGYLSDTLRYALHPPLAFSEIAGWGAAACVMSKLLPWRSPFFCVVAAGGGVATLLLLDTGLRQFSDGSSPSPWALAGQLFNAMALLSVLGLATFRVREKERIQDTTFGATPGKTGWDCIGGLEDVKKEVQMAVQHHFDKRTAKLAKSYGLTTVKGILFYGPPGCGKTMFAKVMASQAGANFFTVSGADFRSKWYGEAEKNVAKVFAEARKHVPSVIFFDEIDQMLGKREETMTSDSPERRVVAQFLSEMDGVKELGNVLVVGATNEPDLIDPAALRPGRFDKLIYIPLPDAPARAAIFRVQLRGKPQASDVDPDRLARLTERFSGADIADLCSKVAEQSMHQSLEGNRAVDIAMAAFEVQLKSTKPSVTLKLLEKYDQLQEKYNRRTLQSQTGAHEERECYTWAKIGGLLQVRKEMEEAIELPLRKPEAYEKFKIRPPKGVLLFGPPGCGKTLMAKIVAYECGAHFLSVDAKKESAESIKEWFLRARENKPCVLFFDEVDSLAIARDVRAASDHGVLTQLLVEMDGMKDLKQVVVIAATNRPDVLDSALLRPGRFDRLIYVPPPDTGSRLQILRIHLADKPLAADVDFASLAQQTDGYSGADLASVCYEVSMQLIRSAEAGDPCIGRDDFLKALDRIKPSIRSEALAYYGEMNEKFRRG